MDDAFAITFAVQGQPVPQPRPRISTFGGRGRAYVPARHAIHGYRRAVALAAALAAKACRHVPTNEAVIIEIEAVFARPQSHLLASGETRASAPRFPPKCDWDNIGKGVGDAITDSGAVWIDDDQVIDARVRKRYAIRGEQAFTRVTVRSASNGAA